MKVLSESLAKKERRKKPHKGLDCVSLRFEGEHFMYVCTSCLYKAIADLTQGDDTVWVDCWGISKNLISANQKISCFYAERE